LKPLVGDAGSYKFILTVKDDFEEDPGSKSYNINIIVYPYFSFEN